jgi:uncharacterized protein YuzE
MRIYYDPEADAAYIAFGERGGPVTTQELDEEVYADFGPDDLVVGIEVLNARSRLGLGSQSSVQVEAPFQIKQPV